MKRRKLSVSQFLALMVTCLFVWSSVSFAQERPRRRVRYPSYPSYPHHPSYPSYPKKKKRAATDLSERNPRVTDTIRKDVRENYQGSGNTQGESNTAAPAR